MDTNEAASQPQVDYAQHEAERVRIVNKLGKQLEGEPLPESFAAVISLAESIIGAYVQQAEAKKVFAKLFLAQAVNSAFTVGLTDEELQEAILVGENDAKAAMQAGADFMNKIMEETTNVG